MSRWAQGTSPVNSDRNSPAVSAPPYRPPETPPPPAWTSTGLVEVETELDRLPPQLAEALVLTQVVGLSYEEAAEVMGVPIGTIRSRVFRARAALMESLSDGPPPRVVALPGGVL